VSLRRIAANTLWLVSERILRLVLGFGIGVLVARYLGPEAFGRFSLALSLFSVGAVVVGLGLDGPVVRDLVRDPARHGELLGTVAALRALVAVPAWGFALAAMALIRPADPESWALVAIACLALPLLALDVIDLKFQASLASRVSVIVRVFSLVAGGAMRLVAMAGHASLRAFAWIGVLEALLTGLGLVLAHRVIDRGTGRWRVHRETARSLLAEAWPLLLSGLAVVVYTRIDQVMLGTLLGDGAVGVFAAATRLSEAWYFVPTAIVSSVTPALVEARERDAALYLGRLERLFRGLARLSMAVALGLSVLSGPLVAWCYGGRYAAAGPVLAIHAWTAVFVSLGIAQGQWNVNEGLGRLLLQRTLLAAGLNILLNGVLIPRAGAAGAAIATLVSQAFATVIANALDRRTRGILRMQLRAFLPW
jgi:PST family polysaccharide transporter